MRGGWLKGVAHPRHGVGRAVRRQVEPDDLERRVPVGRDLAGVVEMARDRNHVGSRAHPRDGCRDLRFERRLAREGRVAVRHEDKGRWRDAELFLEHGARACRLEVLQLEPAGHERGGSSRRQRQGDHEDGEPGEHDRPAPPDDECPKPLEGAVGHLRLADLDGELDLGGTADRGDRGAVALVREADCTTDEPRLETAARNHIVQPNVAERPGLLGLLGADHLDLEVAKVLARLRQDLHHVPRGA